MGVADDIDWLKRGGQKGAIAQVLLKPMTATEIYQQARRLSPRIQIRDISFLMKQFHRRGLAVCLNPRDVTGKVHSLTERGREAVRGAFGLGAMPTPHGIDWRKYAQVARAKVRKLILTELSRSQHARAAGVTAAMLKRRLQGKHALGLNPTIRGLKELASLGLVECVGRTKKRDLKLYLPSEEGRRIAGAIQRL